MYVLYSLTAQFLECRDNSNTCCDRHELCKFWSTINECVNNEQWMNINCQVSCNACFSPAPKTPVKQTQLRPEVEKIAQSASVQQQQRPPKNPKPSGGAVRQGNNNPQQCLKIQSESSDDVIEEMKNEGLILEFEDTSNRRLIGSVDIAGSNGQFGCAPQMDANIDCSRNACFNNVYRSFDGVCNNFRNPLWGASATPFLRLKPFDYDDGVDAPT
uniref:ShKT domain-containing protein n=1 Tax=Romanomermis culicivorax TaxID=13658 RepID=A0A915JI06_ROMCU